MTATIGHVGNEVYGTEEFWQQFIKSLDCVYCTLHYVVFFFEDHL